MSATQPERDAMNNTPILLICSPSKVLHTFDEVLHAKLQSPMMAATLQAAGPILAQTPLALVVCASELIDGTYRDVLRIHSRARRAVPVLVVSLRAREEECAEARRLGAADCMPRPLSIEEVQTLSDKAFELIARTRDTA